MRTPRHILRRFLYKKNEIGFTLIELLLVIAIISVLAVAVFVALNPAQRLKDGKDARRTADIDSILSAVHSSIVDDKGSYPSNFPAAGTEVQLGTDGAACNISNTHCSTAAACIDLMAGAENLTPYLKSMPISPQSGSTTYTAGKTGYAVVRDTNGIVTVKACGTEGTTTISASR